MSMFDTEVWITVLEYLRGYPVAGADVTLFDTGSFLETTGKTDGNGIFKTFVRTSRYILTVSASGYRDWVLEVGIGGTLFEQLAVLITDSPEPPIDPPVVVDVAIHVNDSSGNPVVGASVSLDGMSRTTNWAGIAYFAEIGISLYDYVVVAEGFHDASGVIDVNNIKDLYLTLTQVEEPPPDPVLEYTLTVQVKYMDGSPAGSVAVSTVRLEGGYSNGGLTDSNGIIQFTNALLGNYRTTVGSDQKEVYLDRDKTVLFQIETPPEPPDPDPGESPCPNPENIWPWYSGAPYYATPIWKETYKTWNIWHLDKVSQYGITKPDCVAYSQTQFRSSITAARTWINEVKDIVEKQTLAVYCKDMDAGTNLYDWGEVALDGVVKSVTGAEVFFTGTEVGGHTVELKSLLPGYEFDHWESVIGEGWTEVLINNPNSLSTGITTQSGPPGGLIALVKKEVAVGIPTTLTLSAPSKAGVGEKFNISGILYETESSTPIPNQTINHSYNGKTLGSSTTGADGTYLKEVSIPESGIWTIKSKFPGTETLGASNSEAEVIVSATLTDTLIKIAVPAAIVIALTIYILK